MRPQSLTKISHTLKEEATSNETTFLVALWKVLVGESRRTLSTTKGSNTLESASSTQGIGGVSRNDGHHSDNEAYISDPMRSTVRHDLPSSERNIHLTTTASQTDLRSGQIGENEEGIVDWIQTAWDKDHLRCNWQSDFRRQAVPRLEAEDNENLIRLLKRYPRIQTPRPDLTYGLKRTAFTKEERVINDAYPLTSELTNRLYHAFFIVECKTSGTLEEAENQCCRGGATMVNARRQFNDHIRSSSSSSSSHIASHNSSDGSYADLNSCAFSLALTPSIAHLYIHWAEIRLDKEVFYHMTLMDTYSMMKPSGKDIQSLRHDINNVLNWGILQRKNTIQQTMKTMKETRVKSDTMRKRMRVKVNEA